MKRFSQTPAATWVTEAVRSLRMPSKHLESAGASTPRACGTGGTPSGVGAAEQKRPKARVAKTERVKERMARD